MKRRCAVFTIVKNENYFLPIWLKHYKKYFDNSDIYVLDHQTTDGSTDNLDVNVEKVINELAFDHAWLVQVIQDKQKELLEKYECVLFAESDELVYHPQKPLSYLIDEFLNSEKQYQTCTGYEVTQDLDKEIPLNVDDNIFDHRNYWFRYHDYDKTLLTKIPLSYVWGFHVAVGKAPDYSMGLKLCHLHRCDFELMLKRHEERAYKWNKKNDGGGIQHSIGDRENLLIYFKKMVNPLIRIPQEDKMMLR